MAKKPMDKGKNAKGHLAEGEKRLLLVAAMLTGLSVLLFVTAFDPNDVGSSAVFASFVVFIAGMSLAIGTLSYAKAMKRIPWFVSVGILLFSATGLYCGIGFRDGLAPAQIMQAFTIVGFAVLLMIAARQCAQKWLNYRFSQGSGSNRIEYEGTQHSVEAVFWVGIILVAFGALAYLFLPTAAHLFKPLGNDDKNWLTLTTIVLAAAGLVTYWWAAKGNFIKSVQTDEMIAAGKRDEMKNTAQLIADASAMLSKSDPEKSAGLAFLNQVASDENGLFSREAYDLLLAFIKTEESATINNLVRLKAIGYANNLRRNKKKFPINSDFILIKALKRETDIEKYDFKNLRMKYSYFDITNVNPPIIRGNNRKSRIIYDNCRFHFDFDLGKYSFTDGITVMNCEFIDCLIGEIFFPEPLRKVSPNGVNHIRYSSNKTRFIKCDFSGCAAQDIFVKTRGGDVKGMFENCYFLESQRPKYLRQGKDIDGLYVFKSRQDINEWLQTLD